MYNISILSISTVTFLGEKKSLLRRKKCNENYSDCRKNATKRNTILTILLKCDKIFLVWNFRNNNPWNAFVCLTNFRSWFSRIFFLFETKKLFGFLFVYFRCIWFIVSKNHSHPTAFYFHQKEINIFLTNITTRCPTCAFNGFHFVLWNSIFLVLTYFKKQTN